MAVVAERFGVPVAVERLQVSEIAAAIIVPLCTEAIGAAPLLRGPSNPSSYIGYNAVIMFAIVVHTGNEWLL